MARKKIMFLGGGEQQLPFLQEARAAGYRVVLCDYLPDCPGRACCDKHYLTSTYDRDALLSVARKERVDGVLTNSEPVQMNVSYLTDTLGLPSVPMPVMERFRNKDKMRAYLTPLGLSDLRFRACMSLEEALGFFRQLGGRKMILKPMDNSASVGVYSVQSPEEIAAAFSQAAGANRASHGVLAEEYVEGVEFTVDGIALSGKHHSLGVSRKKHFPGHENVACELLFGFHDPEGEYDYDALRALNDRIVEAAGLPYGMTHAEYKYAEGRFRLIEIAARGGGLYISTGIVPFLSGLNTMRMLLDAAVGEASPDLASYQASAPAGFGSPGFGGADAGRMELGGRDSRKAGFLADGFSGGVQEVKERAAVLRFFQTPGDKAGIVRRIEGMPYLAGHPEIRRYALDFAVGDRVSPPENDAERIGYYIACAPSMEALRKCMAGVAENFRIVF